MSGSTRALGKAIEAYLRGLGADYWFGVGWVTVAQVAREMEITKVTARRYLNLLVEAGVCTKSVRWTKGGRQEIFDYTEGWRWASK
jgi:hypothetical protein